MALPLRKGTAAPHEKERSGVDHGEKRGEVSYPEKGGAYPEILLGGKRGGVPRRRGGEEGERLSFFREKGGGFYLNLVLGGKKRTLEREKEARAPAIQRKKKKDFTIVRGEERKKGKKQTDYY